MALRKAGTIAIVAGVLLIFANVTGGTYLLQLGDRLARFFLPADIAQPVHLVIQIGILVAGLGGFAVLAGGLCYRKGWRTPGNLLVTLGAGVGLLGLALLLLLALVAERSAEFFRWLVGPAGVGVILSVWARREAK
ncbi:MAG TPA: hypothetical protein VGR28_15410 [Candidatus Thermoplasmatota archaeon]|nr:hypothetical protein [Candidatus Thermoplasmatota archaeon]